MGPYKVYKYTFPNGMIYVGCTSVTLAERRDTGDNHNPRLKQAIRECGWRAIDKEIIKDNLSQKEAFELEIKTIADLNATDENIGYNISHGGKSTFANLKHTDDYRKHMSELCKGRTFSPETLAKMKEAHGKERKPVIGIKANGDVLFYESLVMAAKEQNTYSSTIARACKRKGIYKNIKWQFADER